MTEGPRPERRVGRSSPRLGWGGRVVVMTLHLHQRGQGRVVRRTFVEVLALAPPHLVSLKRTVEGVLDAPQACAVTEQMQHRVSCTDPKR